MPEAAIPKLDLGRVVRIMFSAIGANFLNFTILVLLFATLPIVAIEWAFAQYGLIETTFGSLLLTALESIPVALATGAITQGVILHFDGRQAALGDCLTVGIRMLLPLLLVSLLTAIGVGFGAILLLVPGIIVAVTLSVASPALVVEKVGVFDALIRSSNLTKGSRWGVFALGAAYVIAYLLISFGAGYLIGAVARMSAEEAFLATPLWLNLVVIAVATTLSTLIASAGAAALYHELRTMKEGVSSSQLAEVFG